MDKVVLHYAHDVTDLRGDVIVDIRLMSRQAPDAISCSAQFSTQHVTCVITSNS